MTAGCGVARCYTEQVPTDRPRHMITETEPVKAALDELRRLQGGEKVALPALVIRGAEERVRDLKAQGEAERNAREEITGWIRTGKGPAVEVAAADEAKRRGLVANYEK